MVGNYMWNIPFWWVMICDNHMYSIVDDNHYNHYPMIMDIIIIITLWLFNIAMENGPFIGGLPIKNGDFHGYVK